MLHTPAHDKMLRLFTKDSRETTPKTCEAHTCFSGQHVHTYVALPYLLVDGVCHLLPELTVMFRL